jgi:hypothetical protein
VCTGTDGDGALPGKYAKSRCVPDGVPGRVKTRTGRCRTEKKITTSSTMCAATDHQADAADFSPAGSGENMLLF